MAGDGPAAPRGDDAEHFSFRIGLPLCDVDDSLPDELP